MFLYALQRLLSFHRKLIPNTEKPREQSSRGFSVCDLVHWDLGDDFPFDAIEDFFEGMTSNGQTVVLEANDRP